MRLGFERRDAGTRRMQLTSMATLTFRVCSFAVLVAALHAQTLEQAEALWKAQRYDAANESFRVLVVAHPKNPDYKVRWGRLLLERFNREDAATLFQEALEIKKNHAGALLGLAIVAADGFEAKAVESFNFATGSLLVTASLPRDTKIQPFVP